MGWGAEGWRTLLGSIQRIIYPGTVVKSRYWSRESCSASAFVRPQRREPMHSHRPPARRLPQNHVYRYRSRSVPIDPIFIPKRDQATAYTPNHLRTRHDLQTASFHPLGQIRVSENGTYQDVLINSSVHFRHTSEQCTAKDLIHTLGIQGR